MSPAGDLDLVVGKRGETQWGAFLNYIENTGTPTTPVFVFQDFFSESSYSYLYDDDYVDDGDVATVPPSNASSYSYLYDDDYVHDDAVATVPSSSQSSYSNPFDGIDVVRYSTPVLADLDNDGTLRPRPSIDGTSIDML